MPTAATNSQSAGTQLSVRGGGALGASGPRRPRPCHATPTPRRVSRPARYSQLPRERRCARLGAGNWRPPDLPAQRQDGPHTPRSVEELRTSGNQSFPQRPVRRAAPLYSRALRMLQEQECDPGP